MAPCLVRDSWSARWPTRVFFARFPRPGNEDSPCRRGSVLLDGLSYQAGMINELMTRAQPTPGTILASAGTILAAL
jgi:hypothetical protein